jgi:hypothetical protein
MNGQDKARLIELLNEIKGQGADLKCAYDEEVLAYVLGEKIGAQADEALKILESE